jgi:hypothetical protein
MAGLFSLGACAWFQKNEPAIAQDALSAEKVGCALANASASDAVLVDVCHAVDAELPALRALMAQERARQQGAAGASYEHALKSMLCDGGASTDAAAGN